MQIIEDNYRTYYELFVYSFYDSDGDGIGDLQGVLEKLDYLNDDDEATEVYVAVGTVYDEDGNDGKVETDYTFSTFKVAVDDSTGELSFTTACSAISSWTLGDPTIEYTIYRNGEEFGTYTQTIDTDDDDTLTAAQLGDEMEVPRFSISSSSTATYRIEVVVTFNGTSDGDTDTVYTISGSYTIA